MSFDLALSGISVLFLSYMFYYYSILNGCDEKKAFDNVLIFLVSVFLTSILFLFNMIWFSL